MTSQLELWLLPIEPTPEMIEAGATELVCFDSLECNSREAAKNVFQAMAEAFRGGRASEVAYLKNTFNTAWSLKK